VLTYVFGIIASAALIALLSRALADGLRSGDRPGDALVSALLTAGQPPGPALPRVVVTVRNPSGAPVFAALAARPALLPAWLAGAHDVSVPRRTLRRRYRPGNYAAFGIAPAGGAAEFAVPVPARARRYRLTAAVGQEGGRLRVHRLRLGPVSYVATGRATIMVE
jgi:hypothetical protein